MHSGSDKFSIYPIIKKLIAKHDAGLHVKTAGTTWLEEVIGLAEADGDALQIAKDVYAGAYGRFEELTAPYADMCFMPPGGCRQIVIFVLGYSIRGVTRSSPRIQK